jgi:hypothetical protein
VKACEALRDFHAYEEYWTSVMQKDRKDVHVALTEIVQKRVPTPPGKPQRFHFDEKCLPITAEALRTFGFTPPEDAEGVVSEARQACSALRAGTFNHAKLAIRARESVNKLADVTCGLSRQLSSRRESEKSRKKWLERGARLLEWVSAALAGAIIASTVKRAFLNKEDVPLSNAGQAAVELVGTKRIVDSASAGVEQAQEWKEDEEQRL